MMFFWQEKCFLANQVSSNGFIGMGVPQDWATHMIDMN